ncbi:MAG: hypothetical protein WKF73_08915 [Nocardioidaceae bacterium]
MRSNIIRKVTDGHLDDGCYCSVRPRRILRSLGGSRQWDRVGTTASHRWDRVGTTPVISGTASAPPPASVDRVGTPQSSEWDRVGTTASHRVGPRRHHRQSSVGPRRHHRQSSRGTASAPPPISGGTDTLGN